MVVRVTTTAGCNRDIISIFSSTSISISTSSSSINTSSKDIEIKEKCKRVIRLIHTSMGNRLFLFNRNRVKW